MVTDGHLKKAFLYELLRGEEPPQMVLGLEVSTDPVLADALRAAAEQAGAAPGALVVRFLPDEPSHAQGVNGMGLEPFYQRPSPKLTAQKRRHTVHGFCPDSSPRLC